jgi:hypothetical protein
VCEICARAEGDGTPTLIPERKAYSKRRKNARGREGARRHLALAAEHVPTDLVDLLGLRLQTSSEGPQVVLWHVEPADALPAGKGEE